MTKISFNSENLKVDWISFNLKGLRNTRIIADHLSNYFTPYVMIDGKPEIGFHDLRKKYKVYIHPNTNYLIKFPPIFKNFIN